MSNPTKVLETLQRLQVQDVFTDEQITARLAVLGWKPAKDRAAEISSAEQVGFRLGVTLGCGLTALVGVLFCAAEKVWQWVF